MRKVISDYPVPASVASPSAEPGLSPARAKSLEGIEFTIPKGHFVLAAPGFSMIDTKIWKDGKKFDETRWLDGKMPVAGEEDEGVEDFGWGVVSRGGKSACTCFTLCWRVQPLRLPFVDLPFGAGRHRCIGEQFANLQVATILATLVRELTWTLPAPFPENDYTTVSST